MSEASPTKVGVPALAVFRYIEHVVLRFNDADAGRRYAGRPVGRPLPPPTQRLPSVRLAIRGLLLVLATACGDPVGPWSPIVETTTLWALDRPEWLNRPAGLDVAFGWDVWIEAADATGTWDLYLDTVEHELAVGPPGALGITPSARLTVLEGVAFADVTRAPSDSAAYTYSETRPLRRGNVYVVLSRETVGILGESVCQYFAKLEVVDLDHASGWAVLRWIRNPHCYDPELRGSP